jgi:hypothetical protein
MKRIVGLVVLFVVSSPISAVQFVNGPPPIAPGPPATVADILAGPPGVRTPGAVPTGDYGFSYNQLVQVVINAPGRNNTFFATDYFLSNGRNAVQEVLVGFLAAGVSNVGVPATRYSLTANTTYNIDDYLGAGPGRLNKSGVGALVISAVFTGTNTVDTSGLIVGAARIWTKEPGSNGTNSFTEWGVFQGTIHGDFPCLAVGGRQNNDFRANWLAVNLDTVPRQFTGTFVGGNTVQATVSLPPLSMQELAVPSSLVPTANGYFLSAFFPNDNAEFPWNAGIVSADNITGDSWFGPCTLSTVQQEY